jgi:prophage regulatory protein
MESTCTIAPHGGDVDPTDEPILDRLLTLQEVRVLTSLSKTSIYRKISAGTFPAPRQISPNRVAWSAFELRCWRKACPAGLNSPPPSCSASSEARAA